MIDCPASRRLAWEANQMLGRPKVELASGDRAQTARPDFGLLASSMFLSGQLGEMLNLKRCSLASA